MDFTTWMCIICGSWTRGKPVLTGLVRFTTRNWMHILADSWTRPRTTLTDLPNELLLDIAETLDSKEEERALLLTCKRFASLLQPKILRHVLVRPPPNSTGVQPRPRIERVAYKGQIHCMKMILRYGQESTEQDPSRGGSLVIDSVIKNNALRGAVLGQQRHMVELLLSEGANPCGPTKDLEGSTALHHAVDAGDRGILKLLLESGCSDCIEVRDDDGRTPLHYAAKYSKNIEMARVLLDCEGADLEACDNKGWTPLDCAGRNMQAGMTNFLIERGADITHCDKLGYTAEAYLYLLDLADLPLDKRRLFLTGALLIHARKEREEREQNISTPGE